MYVTLAEFLIMLFVSRNISELDFLRSLGIKVNETFSDPIWSTGRSKN